MKISPGIRYKIHMPRFWTDVGSLVPEYRGTGVAVCAEGFGLWRFKSMRPPIGKSTPMYHEEDILSALISS